MWSVCNGTFGSWFGSQAHARCPASDGGRFPFSPRVSFAPGYLIRLVLLFYS